MTDSDPDNINKLQPSLFDQPIEDHTPVIPDHDPFPADPSPAPLVGERRFSPENIEINDQGETIITIAHEDDISVGQKLIMARENSPWKTHAEVTKETGVPSAAIAALEANQWDMAENSMLAIKTTIKTLCLLYGIDSKPIIIQFETAYFNLAAENETNDGASSENAPEIAGPKTAPNPMSIRFGWALSMIILLIAMLIVGYAISSKMEREIRSTLFRSNLSHPITERELEQLLPAEHLELQLLPLPEK